MVTCTSSIKQPRIVLLRNVLSSVLYCVGVKSPWYLHATQETCFNGTPYSVILFQFRTSSDRCARITQDTYRINSCLYHNSIIHGFWCLNYAFDIDLNSLVASLQIASLHFQQVVLPPLDVEGSGDLHMNVIILTTKSAE